MSRSLKRTMPGVLGLVLLAASLMPAQATAKVEDTVEPLAGCKLAVGSITAGGDHRIQVIDKTTPPRAWPAKHGPMNLWPDGKAWLSSSMFYSRSNEQIMRWSDVVIGQELYGTGYATTSSGTSLVPGTYGQTKIGGGWYRGAARFYDLSRVPGRTNYSYALIGEYISRWDNATWKRSVYGGFGAVKTTALISQTKTYDSFIATTKGGALYTIRIPVSGSAVVKRVRSSTWQAFDALVAERCGTKSTMLLGIDTDTNTGYVYAVSHAAGTATAITGHGKVNTTFPDNTYFRYYYAYAPTLFGE